MGRDEAGSYHPRKWTPPSYTVDDDGKVVGGYIPDGPNNWGRWGVHDKRGTTNLITPEIVAGAAQRVSKGVVFSLALAIDGNSPRWAGRPAPKHYFSMTGADGIAGLPYSAVEPGVAFADDYIDMALQASTQWDGFAHWSYQDSLYNGYWAGSITAAGSAALEISALKEAFVGRGVLLDVGRHIGRHVGDDVAPPSTAITPALLDEVVRSQGVEVRSGDIVIVRTGHLGRWYTLDTDADRQGWHSRQPGLSRSAVSWLHDRDIAALAIDNSGVEVVPHEDPVGAPHPIHRAALIDLGLPLGELWWLDDLAADCAADGVFECLLSAPPLNIPGAIGSVLNPIAIK